MQVVLGQGDTQTYKTLKFFLVSFGLDSILLTEGNILDS